MPILTESSAGLVNCASARSISRTWETASIIEPWLPSCPTGRRRPMTDLRSTYDQRRDARRRLYPDGDYAGARIADGAARTRSQDDHDGAGLGRDLRCRLRAVHLSGRFRL